MAESKKGRKLGRNRKSGQNLRYKNERRQEQNQLRTLRRYVKRRGMTGQDVLTAYHRCEIVLGMNPTQLKLNPKRLKKAASA